MVVFLNYSESFIFGINMQMKHTRNNAAESEQIAPNDIVPQ